MTEPTKNVKNRPFSEQRNQFFPKKTKNYQKKFDFDQFTDRLGVGAGAGADEKKGRLRIPGYTTVDILRLSMLGLLNGSPTKHPTTEHPTTEYPTTFDPNHIRPKPRKTQTTKHLTTEHPNHVRPKLHLTHTTVT